MPKLRNLPPRIGTVPDRLSPANLPERERSRNRNLQAPWRRWYKLARWVKLRERILIRDLFTCAECGRMHGGKGTAAIDHKKPHRGSETLFWDENNLQVLCITPCHSKHKQRIEANEPPGVWY